MTQAPAQPMPGSDRESRDRALFDGIAEKYTRKDLHPTASVARRQRLRRTLDAAPLDHHASILEAGCGAGFSARYLEGRFGRFVGIDYADNLITAARRHNTVLNTRFQTANIKQLSLDESFDAIVMIGVLHHLDDMDAAMRELVAALKPGGWLLANEPQPGNPLIRAARSLRKRVDASYSDEQDQLSADCLRRLYERAGLVDVDVLPQGLLSTPFAEVPLAPTWLTRPAARATCALDTALEKLLGRALGRVSWNLVARGRRP
ncbi:MAG: class I SAM-dependent methyltransferase [Phycisphaeraceae bacterium]